MSDSERRFPWPAGKRGAVSLSFDDARPSQVDAGVPILNRHGVRATFYVWPRNLALRVESWKQAVAAGHEIGNHTVSHPCGANYCFDWTDPLEDFTLDRMERELLEANDEVQKLLGVRPTSFAYPCGQTYVGKGAQCRSYVPLVAKHFTVGRSAFDECSNNPFVMDLAQAYALSMDDSSRERLQGLVDAALAAGNWLMLLGHNVRSEPGQTVNEETLDWLCSYLTDAKLGAWVDTDSTIGAFVAGAQK